MTTPPDKTALLAEMDAIWNEMDALLDRFGDKLDTRMPIQGPAWTGRQFLGHLLGSMQSTPYYLMQPRDGGVIEGVIGDPYWRQIYATATIASFRAMLYAAHIGTVLLVETADEADLGRTSPYPQGGETTALEILWFNYNVHLRSHVEDLRKWVQTGDTART
jgi:hypothetical protein